MASTSSPTGAASWWCSVTGSIDIRRGAADNGERSFESLLSICCLVSFVCYFGSYLRIPVLPLYAASLGAGTVQIGMINACFLLMAGLLSIPLGILSDRLGRRSLILAGLACLAGSSFLLWFSTTPLQMMAIYLLFGAGLAAFAPTMMSYVADFTPDTHLGRAYGWYTMAMYCGMTLGPATGGFLAHGIGLRAVFLVSGVVTLLMIGVVIPLLPFAGGRCHDGGEKPPPLTALARELAGNRVYLAALLATVGSCFGFGVFVTFFPLFAHSHGIEAGGIGLVFGSQALANALSRLPFGYLSDRIARRSRLVIIGLLVFSASLAVLAGCHRLLPFMLASAILGVGMGTAYTAIGALITEAAPVRVRGLAMGGYNTCIYLGMMVSSAVMGVVIKGVGFAGGFLLTAAVTALMTGGFWIMLNSVKGEK